MKKLLYIPAILFLAACSQQPQGKAAKQAELDKLKKQEADLSAKITKLQTELGSTDSVKRTEVNIVDIKAGSFTNYVQVQGSIDAKDNVLASPQSAGAITAIYVKVGDHVSKGQTLAQLDNSVQKEQIAQGQTALDMAKTMYNRQKNLWDQKIGTEVQFIQAQTNLQSAQKTLAMYKQQSDLARIVSPINGTIDQMDLKIGQAASPATTIRIVNTESLKVKANVPESYAARVHQGDMVKVVVPDANDSVTAKITFAAKAIDAASRSFAIEIQLPGSSTIKPNMTAILKIADYSNKDAVVVPLNSIQRSTTGGDYVFVADNGEAKKKIVKVGAVSGAQAEILNGLSNGDKLITQGASEVEDGDKIKVSTAN